MDQSLPEQIAWACRILAMGGHDDFARGQVSARAGDRVLMKRDGIGLEDVTPQDVLTIDFDARKVAGAGRVHVEAVLHTGVYQVRPDVGAVIHTHPPYTTALAATGARLELLNHDAVLFKDGLATFDEMVGSMSEASQGAAVARALGDKRAVLMRGHGVLVTGKTVPWAVYTALALERAIQIQVIARTLGELRPMPAEMADRVFANKDRDQDLATYWDFLIRRVRRAGLGDDIAWSLAEEAYARPIHHP
jgi:ribulose-5-phosphate 4-epimerase/fuculose-1-phosphate aldolase